MKNKLITSAIICLVTANAIPAFWLGGTLTIGVVATVLEFLAVFDPGLERGQRPAAGLGIIANTAFLVTFVAIWTNRRTLARRSAVVAAVSAFASFGFLLTGNESFLPGPGSVLWLATGLLLVFGTRRENSSHAYNETGRKSPVD